MVAVIGIYTVFESLDPVRMLPKRRGIDVDATLPRRIDVNMTSFLRHMPAGDQTSEINFQGE